MAHHPALLEMKYGTTTLACNHPVEVVATGMRLASQRVVVKTDMIATILQNTDPLGGILENVRHSGRRTVIMSDLPPPKVVTLLAFTELQLVRQSLTTSRRPTKTIHMDGSIPSRT